MIVLFDLNRRDRKRMSLRSVDRNHGHTVDTNHSRDRDIYQPDSVLQLIGFSILENFDFIVGCVYKPLQSAADLAPGPAVTPILPVMTGHFEHCC